MGRAVRRKCSRLALQKEEKGVALNVLEKTGRREKCFMPTIKTDGAALEKNKRKEKVTENLSSVSFGERWNQGGVPKLSNYRVQRYRLKQWFSDNCSSRK